MPPPKRENLFLNLGFNLLLPVIILNKGAKLLPFLPPAGVMIVALLFPVCYFFYDLKTRKKYNLLSILGMVGVLLTGSIGLMKLSPMVFAIKETAMPLLIGVAVVASLKTKNPLIHAILYNPEIFDAEKIDSRLDTAEKKGAFDKLMVACTWIIAASFLFSAILNFFITRMIVTTNPKIDQAAFNAEVGTQYWVSLIVIGICTLPISLFAMIKLFKGIERLTDLKMEEVLHDQQGKEEKA
ncbi:MAG: VC0807 family protein [Verrucomicrobiota bacterium]